VLSRNCDLSQTFFLPGGIDKAFINGKIASLLADVIFRTELLNVLSGSHIVFLIMRIDNVYFRVKSVKSLNVGSLQPTHKPICSINSDKHSETVGANHLFGDIMHSCNSFVSMLFS